MGKGSAKETAGDLRSRLAQGEVLEIAGYELAPALAESIAARKLPGILERLQEPALAVLEVGATEEPSAATMRMLEAPGLDTGRSEEHTSELQSLMRISYADFCLKKKK